MRIEVNWTDGSKTIFEKIDSTENGDKFVTLFDEEGETIADLSISVIKSIKYD